jgi:DNA-binding FadR family transcriptional regulator
MLFFNQVAQSAACNQRHNIEQRCCRWLLMTHDRVQSDQFLLTQEFLGMMLGVRRTSVTDVAGELRHRKLINYSRGRVTILDRPGLEGTPANATRSAKKNLTACWEYLLDLERLCLTPKTALFGLEAMSGLSLQYSSGHA